MLPRERTKIPHLPVTPTEWLPIAEKSIHRLLLNSPRSYPLALELVLHSAIVTDFTMERLPDSFSCPESRICLKRNSHTDGACFPGKEQKFLTYRSHQRSGSPIGEKSIHRLLLNLSKRSYPCLGAGSSLRNCDRLYHGKTYLSPFSCPFSCNQFCYKQSRLF